MFNSVDHTKSLSLPLPLPLPRPLSLARPPSPSQVFLGYACVGNLLFGHQYESMHTLSLTCQFLALTLIAFDPVPMWVQVTCTDELISHSYERLIFSVIRPGTFSCCFQFLPSPPTCRSAPLLSHFTFTSQLIYLFLVPSVSFPTFLLQPLCNVAAVLEGPGFKRAFALCYWRFKRKQALEIMIVM